MASRHPVPDRVVAVSADLQSSRQVEGRGALAHLIETTLETMNRVFREDWIAGLQTTRGIDEVSGVLACRRHVFDIVAAVNVALWPHRFRFAVTDGTLDVVGSSASDMDGPAFHRAADALQRAHEGGLPLAIEFEKTPPAQARLAEAAADLHHGLMTGWTDKVAEVARMLHRPPGSERRTQTAIGVELGKTQQAVSDLVRKGSLESLERSERALRAWLAEEDRR